MSNKWIKASIVPALALFMASAASAQESIDSTRTGTSSMFGADKFSAELKPLPTILSVIPGVAGAGAGAELLVGRDTAVYTEVNYLDSNLSGASEAQAKDRAGDGLYPNKVRAVNIDVGGRFYTSPLSSSWYGGAKLGYSTLRGQWFYKDEVLNQRTASLTPGINAGYRWKWENDVLLRLGAGAAANFVQFQHIDRENDSKDSLDAQDKMDDEAHSPILANLDLGVGYVF